jgi:glycosyltransferase involved in cell wall biosynthesis
VPLDILVPYWGDPALMRRTVESVLTQTSDDWRLTVVDDAYPDRQVTDWLDAMDDPRVRSVRHAENLGITENYRHCLSLATEDLVVFLGCDDLLLPRYVEVVLAAHRRFPEAVMVQPGVRVVDDADEPAAGLVDVVKQRLLRPRSGTPTVRSGESLAVSLLRGNWLYWPSLTFRREAVEAVGFRDELPIIQDFALEIDLVCRGGALVVEPTVCFLYRRHGSSASATTLTDGTRFADERTYYGLAAQQMRERGWPRAERAARARLTSRAHALALVPGVVRRRRWDALRMLGRHVVARP